MKNYFRKMSKEKNAVLGYLEKVNRPYSANDILQNLHKEFGKAAILKALDHLVSEKKVHEKTYGKQKVYAIIQKDTGNPHEELQKLETKVIILYIFFALSFLIIYLFIHFIVFSLQILEKTEILRRTERELKQAEDQLKTYESTLTTEEAQSQIDKLKSEIEKKENKLAKLSSNTVLISEQDRQKIKKRNEMVIKEYKKRKRICMDILNSILENYPKSKSALVEEIGLELDDEKNTPPIP